MLLGRYLHRYWESEFFKKKKTIRSATGNVTGKGDFVLWSSWDERR